MISKQRQSEAKPEIQAMFVVPKKKFKAAHDRNKLKRRMREAYRLQKAEFYVAIGNTGLDLAFVYTSSKQEDYKTIYQAFNKLLTGLMP